MQRVSYTVFDTHTGRVIIFDGLAIFNVITVDSIMLNALVQA